MKHVPPPVVHFDDAQKAEIQKLALPGSHPLTPREFEIIAYAYSGYTANNIVQQNSGSEQTVRNQRGIFYDKFGVAGQLELIAKLVPALGLERMGARHREKLASEEILEPKPKSKSKSPLTDRERQIVRLLISDDTPKEIASDLDLSTKTVEAHKFNIYRKLRISSLEQLKDWAGKNRGALRSRKSPKSTAMHRQAARPAPAPAPAGAQLSAPR